MHIEYTLIARANGTLEVIGSHDSSTYSDIYRLRQVLIRSAWFRGFCAQPTPEYVLLRIQYPEGVVTPPWVKGSSEQISVPIWRRET